MHRWIAAFLALGVAGCDGEPTSQRYENALLSVDSATGHIELTLSGRSKRPCPPALNAVAMINGLRLEQTSSGGAEVSSEDDPHDECDPVTFEADDVPLDSGKLSVTFRNLDTTNGPYGAPADFLLETEWTPVTTWTDSDFAAAMHEGKEFAVHWTPVNAPAPELSLGGFVNNGWGDLDGVQIETVRSAPGIASYRFKGPEPKVLWTVVGGRDVFGQHVTCRGFTRCSVNESQWLELTPAGVSPGVAAGQAPPRECIVPEGKSVTDYDSMAYFPLPDLTPVHVATQPSCAGSADLYFVFLGGCSAHEVGKATYVVGNRGSVISNFHVTSNHETVAGEAVEPQGMSQPFEITFDKPDSRLEITADVSDCTPSDNLQYVRPEP